MLRFRPCSGGACADQSGHADVVEQTAVVEQIAVVEQTAPAGRTLHSLLMLAIAAVAAAGSGCVSPYKAMETIHYDKMAGKAWTCRAGVFACECKDFKYGFMDGYVGAIRQGGDICQPVVPPKRYWCGLRCCDRDCTAVTSYFNGWTHGVMACEQDGYAGFNQVPLRERPRVNAPYGAYGGHDYQPGLPAGPIVPQAVTPVLLPEAGPPAEEPADDEMDDEDEDEDDDDDSPLYFPEADDDDEDDLDPADAEADAFDVLPAPGVLPVSINEMPAVDAAGWVEVDLAPVEIGGNVGGEIEQIEFVQPAPAVAPAQGYDEFEAFDAYEATETFDAVDSANGFSF